VVEGFRYPRGPPSQVMSAHADVEDDGVDFTAEMKRIRPSSHPFPSGAAGRRTMLQNPEAA
jgi:hypothetical protein